jgi:hypothetical protein
LLAVFIRDLDRTTLEFERNSGIPDDSITTVTGDKIGLVPIDHVGIRINNPEAGLLFYAKNFGFVKNVSTYVPNPDKLKNGRPYVVRSIAGCDINFIINANQDVSENILIVNSCVRPGILYIGTKFMYYIYSKMYTYCMNLILFYMFHCVARVYCC